MAAPSGRVREVTDTVSTEFLCLDGQHSAAGETTGPSAILPY